MKVGEQQSSTAVGMQTTQAFQIKTSPKAFEILSSGIYSDKVLAPIRELAANAVDAHKVVGRVDQPFEVQLPTQLSPLFRVRDFGPGLSEQEVMSLYTTYFESTKSDSNDYIGCLGLGSKSPFAYTDSFTVESYQAGILKIYAAHLVQGLPSISKVSESPTIEPDGLAVSFAVQSEDISKFQEKAFQLYSWFTVKPRLNLPVPDRYPDNNKGHLETQGMYLKENGYGSAAVHVLMGEIAYPVRAFDIQEGYNWDKTYQGLVLRAEIGDVDIATSRETLGFTAKTKQWIKHKIDVAPKVFAEELVNVELAKCADWWEAWLKSEEYRKFPILGSVKFAYQGSELPSRHLRVPTDKVKLLYLGKTDRKIYGRDGYVWANNFSYDTLEFYRNDVKQGFVKRLTKASADRGIILVTVLEGSTEQEACEALHITVDQLKDLSTITYEREKRGKKGGPLRDDEYIHLTGVTPTTIDPASPKYVVPVRRNYIMVNGRQIWSTRWGHSNLQELIKTARLAGWIEEKAVVVGVPANLLVRATTNGCKDLMAVVWPKMKKHMEDNRRQMAVAGRSAVEQQVGDLMNGLAGVDISPRHSTLWRMKQKYRSAVVSDVDRAVLSSFTAIAGYYGEPSKIGEDPDLDVLWKDFTNNDPIGKIWGRYYNSGLRGPLIDAIKDRMRLLDELHELRLHSLGTVVQAPKPLSLVPSGLEFTK